MLLNSNCRIQVQILAPRINLIFIKYFLNLNTTFLKKYVCNVLFFRASSNTLIARLSEIIGVAFHPVLV